MKKPLIAIVILALIGVGIWCFSPQLQKESADALTFYGNVDIRQAALSFNSQGRIVELAVEEGSPVKKGQFLAKVDQENATYAREQAQAQLKSAQDQLTKLRNGSRPQEIDQAKAQVAAAEAGLQLATLTLKRTQTLYSQSKGQAISKQTLDEASAEEKSARAQLEVARKNRDLVVIGPRLEDIELAKAQVALAQAQLRSAQKSLDETVLLAPSNGIIRTRLLEVGDMASPSRAVFALALTEPKKIRIYIPESQLGLVQPGSQAHVFVDSAPTQPLKGTVGFISSVAEFTPKTVETQELRTSLVYEAHVITQDSQNLLRLGMPATVQIVGK